jgi:hypothetical protein
MSLLNVVVGDEIAWLCVDTTSQVIADGRCIHSSKMIHFPHINAVVACRGELSFLANIFLSCFFDPVHDFDSLLQVWPKRLIDATEDYLHRAKESAFDVSLVGHEVILLGWSNARSRPVCLASRRQSASEIFESMEVNCRLAPNPGQSLFDFSSLASLEEVARAQVHAVRVSNSGDPIGGKLLLAELTAKRTLFSEIALLD